MRHVSFHVECPRCKPDKMLLELVDEMFDDRQCGFKGLSLTEYSCCQESALPHHLLYFLPKHSVDILQFLTRESY